MASVKALLYKSKKKADGRHPIVIRIIKDRKPKYVYVDWIFEKHWDLKNLKVKSSHPNSKRLNNLLKKKLVEADDLILESEAQNRNYTAEQIAKLVKGEKRNSSFFKLSESYILDLQKIGKHNRASTDGGKINRIKEFMNDKDLQFFEIDEALLKKLKVFLIGKHSVSERTVMNYYVLIRTLFNLAITNKLIENKYYPFGKGKIRIKFPETIKIGLEEDEIKAIEGLKLEKGSMLWHSRNVFLFSFYLAGIRISDVLKMRWTDIIDDRLNYKMSKNNKVTSLKMPAKTIEIINCYKSKNSKDDFIFPELKKADLKNDKDVHAKIRTATKKFNKYLKQIGELAEIDKKITTHIARHSFGNIAGDKVSPQMLQKLYRHTSLNTTIGYQGNFIHKDADDALDSVIGF